MVISVKCEAGGTTHVGAEIEQRRIQMESIADALRIFYLWKILGV